VTPEHVDVADVPDVPDNIGPGKAPDGVVIRVWAVDPVEEIASRLMPNLTEPVVEGSGPLAEVDADVAHRWALEHPGRTVYLGIWDGDTGDLMGGLVVEPGPAAGSLN
jgi:hypothetical protein